jgi:hypothetical protein
MTPHPPAVSAGYGRTLSLQSPATVRQCLRKKLNTLHDRNPMPRGKVAGGQTMETGNIVSMASECKSVTAPIWHKYTSVKVVSDPAIAVTGKQPGSKAGTARHRHKPQRKAFPG